MKHILTYLNGVVSTTKIVGDLNTLLTSIDKSTRLKSNKEKTELTQTTRVNGLN